ncbi:MAG: hypothetical protein GWO11_02390, partial [Desulfuromonadales bacterium]|nr:hypothetical protein [Desulfuromonadales bacterium]NIR33333.1 hypothetical protein [Desulfuromonadales bacterium]NIS41448.1 hypothetical protein [Desulfuromonadales bacterium]
MHKLQEQRGAFAPFVGILIVVLILIVGLVVDLGHIHNVRVELQRAVDAAALAGAGQLLGDDEQQARAIAAAEATAEENDVDNEKVSVTADNVVTTVGFWDTEALGDPPGTRFAAGGTPVNAVRVEATRTVEHFFFVLIPGLTSTDVSANAIAVNDREQLTIPLAVISCIPSTGPQQGEINLCGVYTYTFESQVENSAGWTSLTIGGQGGSSQQEIAALFSDPDGLALFNEIAGLL